MASDEAKRWLRMYEADLKEEQPTRRTQWQCAQGLFNCRQYAKAAEIFQRLAESGYQPQESLLMCARCYFLQGYYLQARKLLDSCLALDSSYEEALEFQREFKLSRNREARMVALYISGFLVAGAVAAIYLVRRSKSSTSSSSAKKA